MSEPLLDKLLRRTKTKNSCLEWNGYKQGKPLLYPYVSFNGKPTRVHRLVWSLLNGDIPREKVIMHTCDNSICINPAHLKLGTRAENNLDMYRKGRDSMSRRTTCPIGHPYSKANTRICINGKRYCKSCHWYRSRKIKPRKKVVFG